MTRVYGLLFEDGRDGTLCVKPSKPFFGVSRHARHYPIIEGRIDIELQPTPAGQFYNLGFKDNGDITHTDYTLRLKVPRTAELDISPAQPKEQSPAPVTETSNVKAQTQAKRLASDLQKANKVIEDKDFEIQHLQRSLEYVESELTNLKNRSAAQLESTFEELRAVRASNAPQQVIVEKQVPIADESLKRRISDLERKLSELSDLNAEYYLAVLELNEIKLERARSAEKPSAPVVEARPTDPRSLLLEKIRGN